MRVIFAGTPEFAVPPLQALIAEHEVVAVFTQPDRRSGRGKKLQASAVKEVALEHEIPVHQPSTLKDSYQAELIGSMAADVMVVVAYGMLLPEAILALPKYGCLNIHASLLPRWRGAAPIQRALQAGDQETGVAIMQMEVGLDTGPVFEMLRIDIDSQDTSATLHDKLSKLGAKGIISTLNRLQCSADLIATPQDDSLATYASKISKEEANIDWSRSARAIDAQVRAFVPWPVCESYLGNTRIRVWQCQPDMQQNCDQPPGTLLSVGSVISVSCGEGILMLQTVQRDGGKPVPAAEFCNGFALQVGDRFGHG